MSQLKQVENLERIIMSVGQHFNLKNTVLWNAKSRDGYKLDPVTERAYESTKYAAGNNTVKNITFRSSEYLVFDYKDFQNKVMESVFISYPNMYDVKAFFSQIMQLLSTPGVYNSDDVALEYKEVFIESTPLAGGKKLAAYPVKFTRKDFLVDGICLLINNQECFVEMDLSTIAGINDIVQSFDLLSCTNDLINMGLIHMGLNALFENNSNPVGNSYQQPTAAAPTRPAPAGGTGFAGGGRTFNNRSASNKPLNRPTPQTGSSPIANTQAQAIQQDVANIPDSEIPFTMGEDKPVNNTFQRNTNAPASPVSDNSGIFSIDNITKAANGFDANILGNSNSENPDDIEF